MRPRDELLIDGVRFVGEQDGEAERLLKNDLIAVLEPRTEIGQAYLARVVLEPGAQESIALCLWAPGGTCRAVVDLVEATFAALFAKEEHLDIMFLRVDQRDKLNAVCQPFLVRAATRSGA